MTLQIADKIRNFNILVIGIGLVNNESWRYTDARTE